MTNLTDIAAALREHSPGVLPDFLDEVIINGDTEAKRHIAEAILRDAMVRDGGLDRDVTSEWSSFGLRPGAYDDDCCCGYERRAFKDADHGGCTGAAFAAWRWARGLNP